MSRLEELITELCPNGVNFRKIKDVYKRLQGTPITAGKMKEIDNEGGNIRIFAGGKTVINAFEKDIPRANITRVPAVLVQSRGVIDAIYYDKPFTFKNEMWAYTAEDKDSVKYLYYVLKNNIQYFRESASGMGSLPQISLKVTEDFYIPLPPLPVQREIVRILDNFTELTAELTARKKQYEYYKNYLFEEVSEGDYLTLDDLCSTITDGSHFSPRAVEYGYAMPSVKDMRAHGFDLTYSKKISEEDFISLVRNGCQPQQNDILVAKDGATMLKHAFVYTEQEKVVVLSSIAIFRPKQNLINPQYLAHYFRQDYFRDQVIRDHSTRGGVPRIILKNFKKIKIAVPPLLQQAYIVKILDQFDALVNNISSGLPAEIEARRKQYEYYRDHLLTFKEAKA